MITTMAGAVAAAEAIAELKNGAISVKSLQAYHKEGNRSAD